MLNDGLLADRSVGETTGRVWCVLTRHRRLVLLGFFALALVLRLLFAVRVEHPGHADLSFYYTVAENVASGRGVVVDYIWHYLVTPDTVTHPSYDYWMPLASLLMAPAMWLFGKTLFVALVVTSLAGLALGVATYFLGREFGLSDLGATFAAALVLFVPHLFTQSLVTDSAIYYAVIGLTTVLVMVRANRNPRLYLLAGGCAGLAHLTRQDGVLLLPVLAVSILVSRNRWRARLGYLAGSIAIYLAVVSPLLVASLTQFGEILPAGPRRTVFLTEYEDLYSYGKDLSLSSYVSQGWVNILRAKLGALAYNLRVAFELPGAFLSLFAIIGLAGAIITRELRNAWRDYLVPLAYLAVLYLFYSLIADVTGSAGGFTLSYVGGFLRSALAVIPFMIVLAVEAVERYVRIRWAASALVLMMLVVSGTRSWVAASGNLAKQNGLGSELAGLDAVLNGMGGRLGDETIIMTRIPWQVYHSTRRKAIQIPNEDRASIHAAAMRYGANYLLLPAPRASLGGIYEETDQDRRFQLVAKVGPRLKLFRILPDTGGPARPDTSRLVLPLLVVYYVGEESPDDVDRYALELADTRFSGQRPASMFFTLANEYMLVADALDRVRQAVAAGDMPHIGTWPEVFRGEGPDGAKVVALLFPERDSGR